MGQSSFTTKPKPCKGSGTALGYGCGLPQINRKYGLGLKCQCYQKWLIQTPEGQEKINKAAFKATKFAATKIKNEKQEAKRKLLSPDGYRSKYLQPVINEIARLIDNAIPCIATGNHEGKMAGGHYIATGANRTLTLNLHNIHGQSYQSNVFKGGDNLRYRDGLINRYGVAYVDFIEQMKQHPPIKLSVSEMEDIRKKAIEFRSGMRKEVVSAPNGFTAEQRIQMRNYCNQLLGIYQYKHSVYEK